MTHGPNRRFWMVLLPLVFLGVVGVQGAPKDSRSGAAPKPVDFSRDIRPILSDNCFACHGPDEKERKGRLRLDRIAEALKPAKSGDCAIVPGDIRKSKLIERILSKDPDEVMPPPKTGKKLSASQVDLLRRWVEGGAKFVEHWAFTKPERPPLPRVQQTSWPRNEIDRFILARLEKEKLKPSAEADPTTLLRRASLDLTGLPPTIAEVDAFLADRQPRAYERAVDRLLASARYGEHMARYWLDAARYADSHGYHIDSERSMWKWRDWVVDAFNQNKPFDQFTIEQLAGDLLPEATTGQKVGSGFVRANMSTGEGGAIEEEYQCKYTFDRTETTGTIWLGLTMICARCHTHKYDPIQQREYYSLYAFFNNLNESIMDGNQPSPEPTLRLPTPEQARRREELSRLLADGRKRIDGPAPELDRAQEAWAVETHRQLAAEWTPLAGARARSLSTNGPTFQHLADHALLAVGANPTSDVYEVTVGLEPGPFSALRLETRPHVSLPGQASGRAADGSFLLSELEAELVAPAGGAKDAEKAPGGGAVVGETATGQVKPVPLKFSLAVATSGMTNREIDKAIDGKADTGWAVEPGELGQVQAAVFALAEPVQVSAGSELRVRLKFGGAGGKDAVAALGCFRLETARREALVGALHPVKTEPWQVVGPFKMESWQQGYTNVYEPELKIDLAGVYPGVKDEIKWKPRPGFVDGRSNLLVEDLHGVHGVYYLYRVFRVPSARRVELGLQADHAFKLWVNGRLVAEHIEATPREPLQPLVLELPAGENRFLLKIATLQSSAYFTFRRSQDWGEPMPGDIATILAATPAPPGAARGRVRDFYRRQHSREFARLFDEMEDWSEESASIERSIPTTLVAREREKRRDTFMLVRGEYDRKGDKVEPGVPAVLPPLPAGVVTNRLALARWLVDPSHPLTARVIVNRIWQQYFGVGLVKTAEDFGAQGDPPSHPELLDWLATEFVRTGWDVKELHRLIATSAVYRQSSQAPAEIRARDPENRLLARGPRFRVDAEVVRDIALAVSGLLVEKRGGHAARPFQPEGLWEAVSFRNQQKYIPDRNDGQYRRSMYTYWKRQSPPPNMLLFDAPTREYCVVRRPRTNTPLQALALLNDVQFVEAARAFAQRILLEGGRGQDDRLRFAFRAATGRPPVAAETRELREFIRQQGEEFRKDRGAAEKLLGVGDFKPRAGLDRIELATWSTAASLLLNLDEVLTKD